MTEGSVVTFYSYKGGVGRTLALANVGALLCRWGYKVLCVDWDLEAPGLHLYFESWIKTTPTQDVSVSHPGLTELIQAHVEGQHPKWRDFVTNVRFPKINQSLSLMTAGRQDHFYIERMQALDWKRLYEEHQLGNFLEALRNEWKEEFDFVLVDSRTGITDIGGICTVQLPDHLVLLFTANLQSLRGSLEVVNRAKQSRHSLPFDRAKLLVLPVATRFEARVEYEMAQQWLKKFATELGPLYAEWAHKDVTAEDLLNNTRLPYIPYWSFGEKLPVIEKGTSDPEDIGFSLETLTALVAQKLSYSDLLVKNRDSFVMNARKNGDLTKGSDSTSIKAAPPPKLFISYSAQDFEWLKKLEKHIGVLWHQRIVDMLIGNSVEHFTDTEVKYLEQADITLLLVSSSFLASGFVYGAEMKRMFDRHTAGEAMVIPVILSPALWQETPIGQLQSLPLNGIPVTNWSNQDEALVQVVRGVREAAARATSLRRKS